MNSYFHCYFHVNYLSIFFFPIFKRFIFFHIYSYFHVSNYLHFLINSRNFSSYLTRLKSLSLSISLSSPSSSSSPSALSPPQHGKFSTIRRYLPRYRCWARLCRQVWFLLAAGHDSILLVPVFLRVYSCPARSPCQSQSTAQPSSSFIPRPTTSTSTTSTASASGWRTVACARAGRGYPCAGDVW